MQRQIIKLKALAELGEGSAEITDESVSIFTSGINGALKAWLIGGESTPIGNLVDGRIHREIDTTAHSGILITQCGRQMLIGRYKNASDSIPPFAIDGFEWKKVESRKFDTESEKVKYILSNKTLFEFYKKYGHYYLGKGAEKYAIAFPCRNGENPFSFTGQHCITKNGYEILIVEEKTV